jgi:hypothetical protein
VPAPLWWGVIAICGAIGLWILIEGALLTGRRGE